MLFKKKKKENNAWLYNPVIIKDLLDNGNISDKDFKDIIVEYFLGNNINVDKSLEESKSNFILLDSVLRLNPKYVKEINSYDVYKKDLFKSLCSILPPDKAEVRLKEILVDSLITTLSGVGAIEFEEETQPQEQSFNPISTDEEIEDEPAPEGVTFDLSDGIGEPKEVTVKDGEILSEPEEHNSEEEQIEDTQE